MIRIRVGDIFQIPLSDSRKAYGQYVKKDPMGPVVKIFDLITEENIEPDKVRAAGLLFPPVITGLFAAVKSGLWKRIGHIPISNFEYQNFISATYDEKTKQVGTWYLWDGDHFVPLGKTLPEQYKQLEQLIVWEPKTLVRRIETGENPYEFMIES